MGHLDGLGFYDALTARVVALEERFYSRSGPLDLNSTAFQIIDEPDETRIVYREPAKFRYGKGEWRHGFHVPTSDSLHTATPIDPPERVESGECIDLLTRIGVDQYHHWDCPRDPRLLPPVMWREPERVE